MTHLTFLKTAAMSDDEAEEVVRSNSYPTMLKALKRRDIPQSLLVDLSFSPNPEIRQAVLNHPNIPPMTKARLSQASSKKTSPFQSAALRLRGLYNK